MGIEESDFRYKVPIQETAVPAWQDPTYAPAAARLTVLLGELFRLSEEEVKHVVRMLVTLSSWRDDHAALCVVQRGVHVDDVLTRDDNAVRIGRLAARISFASEGIRTLYAKTVLRGMK